MDSLGRVDGLDILEGHLSWGFNNLGGCLVWDFDWLIVVIVCGSLVGGFGCFVRGFAFVGFLFG